MSEQTANLCTTDACESLRARLAKYEDAEGRLLQSGAVDERAALTTLERFVETVRECYHLASSYSGCLDNVDEHGGDDHEDPICAVFHRLYYAMFDGEKGLEQARATLTASAPNHSEQVREVVPEEWQTMLARVTDELDALNCAMRDQIDDDMAEPEDEAELCDATDELIDEARALIAAAPSAGSQEQGE